MHGAAPPTSPACPAVAPDGYKHCRDKGYIAITTGRILLNQHHPMLVSDFKDNTDLVDAAASSSFIPMWSAGSLVGQYRGLNVYDGGFAMSQPCPPGVKTCVKISTSNPAWPKRSSVETFMARLAFRGPQAIMRPDPTIRKYPPIEPTGSNGPDPAMVHLAASKGVDIAPGEGGFNKGGSSWPRAARLLHHRPSGAV